MGHDGRSIRLSRLRRLWAEPPARRVESWEVVHLQHCSQGPQWSMAGTALACTAVGTRNDIPSNRARLLGPWMPRTHSPMWSLQSQQNHCPHATSSGWTIVQPVLGTWLYPDSWRWKSTPDNRRQMSRYLPVYAKIPPKAPARAAAEKNMAILNCLSFLTYHIER